MQLMSDGLSTVSQTAPSHTATESAAATGAHRRAHRGVFAWAGHRSTGGWRQRQRSRATANRTDGKCSVTADRSDFHAPHRHARSVRNTPLPFVCVYACAAMGGRPRPSDSEIAYQCRWSDKLVDKSTILLLLSAQSLYRH